MGQTYNNSRSVEAGIGGFIVSHKDFDEGAESHNYYSNRIDNELTITGLTSNDTVRLTFITFKLYYSDSNQLCDDYLEISLIRDHGSGKKKFCGHDTSATSSYNFYPANNNIKFKFVTDASHGSAGFLLKYKGRWRTQPSIKAFSAQHKKSCLQILATAQSRTFLNMV